MIEILKIILFEAAFWGLLVASAVVVILICKNFNRRELILATIILIIGLVLRMIFGAFAPLHEKIQYIEILNNFYQNHLHNNFFGISNSYWGTRGFNDYFFNKFLWFFPVFDVYAVYYINLFISLFKGIVLFYFSFQVFNRKLISFFSLLLLMLFPIEIKFAPSELLSQLSSLSLLILLVFFLEYIKTFRIRYLLILGLVFFVNIFGRIDYVLITSLLALIVVLYLFSLKQFRRKWPINSIVIVFFALAALAINHDLYFGVMTNTGQGELWKFTFGYNPIYLINTFNIASYFNTAQANIPLLFISSYFIPLYFYIALQLSPLFIILKCKSRKRYIILYGFTVCLLSVFCYVSISSNIHLRTALPIFPFLILIASYALYRLLKITKLNDRKCLIIGIIIISAFVLQNINFLQLKFSRRVEQKFLIEQIAKIPENSLILTLADKKFSNFQYPKNSDCDYYHDRSLFFEGREFPEYLLAGRNIKVMDICQELDPTLFVEFDSIYYYRGLYSYFGQQNPGLTADFETNNDIYEIKKITVLNINLFNRTPNEIMTGVGWQVNNRQKKLEIGLYSLNFTK